MQLGDIVSSGGSSGGAAKGSLAILRTIISKEGASGLLIEGCSNGCIVIRGQLFKCACVLTRAYAMANLQRLQELWY